MTTRHLRTALHRRTMRPSLGVAPSLEFWWRMDRLADSLPLDRGIRRNGRIVLKFWDNITTNVSHDFEEHVATEPGSLHDGTLIHRLLQQLKIAFSALAKFAGRVLSTHPECWRRLANRIQRLVRIAGNDRQCARVDLARLEERPDRIEIRSIYTPECLFLRAPPSTYIGRAAVGT